MEFVVYYFLLARHKIANVYNNTTFVKALKVAFQFSHSLTTEGWWIGNEQRGNELIVASVAEPKNLHHQDPKLDG